MTTEEAQNQSHVLDRLPAYLNGTLEPAGVERVRAHLLQCEVCQHELAAWQTIKDAASMAIASAPFPSASLLEQVWARIDPPVREVVTQRRSAWHVLLYLWRVFSRQVPLIHKSIWPASALVMAFGCFLSVMSLHTYGRRGHAELILALFLPVVAAAGVAFIYGSENDSALEITLSTPTSIRIVMLCRMFLVIAYNFMLAVLASAVFASFDGGGVVPLVQLWLGPMLLLSSLSLLLTLLIGSLFAVLGVVAMELAQALPANAVQGMLEFHLSLSAWWQTNPLMLCLAVVLIVFAVLYAPRQPRLA
ncbi:MAG: zf-HC2 domain-containing protein [Chloroflexota bacterium]|nr:zf-HC2 domain-containing protein [Chloroflexota bacterium]